MFNYRNPFNLVIVLISAFIIFTAGYNTGRVSGPAKNLNVVNFQQGNTKNIDFSLFWETWRNLDEQFVDKGKLDPQKMYIGAIKGMVASLDDPYTFFMTADENKQSKDDLGGKFEGIGAELGLKGGKIVVISPIKNSPAEKAGIRSGDYIVKVDGKSTDGWTLVKAVQTIRGKGGTPVTLTLAREKKDKEFDIKIIRDTIKVDSVELTFKDSTAILKLNRFGDNTNAEWDKAVAQIVAKYNNKQIHGMVLDMRGNPGGYLQGAVYVASEFLPQGSVVVKQEYNSQESETHTVTRTGKLLAIPLAVLIDKGSASASEIVAGALRDYARATLVGEKSFGKGSVQVALDLKGNAGLHVTVAKWILPKGDWIMGKGIEPKIKVENKIDEGNTTTADTDEQLQKAIEIVQK